MAKMDEYKHPQWQEMRLKAMQHSRFSCASCMSEEKTLHVHHKKYKKGGKVWDVAVTDLVVLCEDCHDRVEKMVSFVRETAPMMLLEMSCISDGEPDKCLLEIMMEANQFLRPSGKGNITTEFGGYEFADAIFSYLQTASESISAEMGKDRYK